MNYIKQVFKFSDPRQERTYNRLKKIGEGLAAYFKDSCKLFEGNCNLETSSHLIAHCLRDIESAIRDVMLPRDFVPNEKSQQKHKDEIEAILKQYKINPEDEIAKLWMRIAGRQEEIALHRLAHRNSLERPRQKDQNFIELWMGIQDLLDVLLDKIETNFLSYIGTLDEMLAKSNIGEADVVFLHGRIPSNPVTYNYFFGKLENPEWLPHLKSKGFFNSPPPAVEHLDGGISYPFWAQAEYLKKMAKLPKKQQEVLDICLSVETNNQRVSSDLLEIALLLTADMAAQIAEKIDEIDNFFSPENYGKLIVHLSENGKVDEAVALARKVLAFKPDPRSPTKFGNELWNYDPVTLIQEHDYEDILSKNYPSFVNSAGLVALKLAFDLLEDFHNLKFAGRNPKPDNDYSSVWCPAIEQHPSRFGDGARESLVTAIRNGSESLISQNPEKFNGLVKEIESRKLPIFRRLKLHLLRLFPTGFEKKIVEELLNKDEFEDRNYLTHEYFLLAKEHGSLLSPKDRQRLLKITREGGEYDKETFEKLCEQKGIEPTDEVARKHKLVWQSYHLAPFKDLEPEFKPFYEEVVSEVGEPESPDLSVRSTGGTWGYKSSITDKEFQEKTPKDIIKKLINFKPSKDEDRPFSKTREGTGRALTTHIAEDPSKWIAVLPSVSELDSTFVRSILTGFREGLKNGKTFDWEPLIELGKEILKKPIENPRRKSSGFHGDDPDWNWSRHTLVELIDDGLSSETNPISTKFREDVWSIIETLIHDPSPSDDEVKKMFEEHDDPLTAAISSTRGDAVDAAIQYGIWLKNSFPEKEQSDWSIKNDAPELDKTFEEKLDVSKDQFLGIRAVFGKRLGNITWLDIKWLEENLMVIFPEEKNLKPYYNTAWETYVSFNPPYDDLLPILRKQYERAIQEIGQYADHKHRLENPDEMLAHHLLQFYFRNKIELDAGLFKDFYDLASVELKGSIISFIGRRFKNSKVNERIIERVVKLAEHRLEVIKKSPTPHEDIQEFKEFSWWVSSECFDKKWALDLLNEALKLGCDLDGYHLVVEEYLTLAEQYPLEVITSLEYMVQNDKSGWGVPTWGNDLREVIKKVLGSESEAAKTKAVEFVNILAINGNISYKDLLESGK